MKFTLSLFLIVLTVNTVFSQELKKRKKYTDNFIEEYFVLKENKHIKQGQYTKLYDFLGRNILVEIGQYEKNEKTGKWCFFYYLDPANPIKCIGNYTQGKKEGVWIYYYEPKREDNRIISFITSENRNKIVKGNLTINTEGQSISARGVYHSDKKIGAWEYYTSKGLLLHKFDHSTHKMIEKNQSDSLNNVTPFLGGYDRFSHMFFIMYREVTGAPCQPNSKVVFKLGIINNQVSFTLMESTGDKKFKDSVSKVLSSIPNDWLIEYITNNNLIFIAEVKTTEEDNINQYDIEFQKTD